MNNISLVKKTFLAIKYRKTAFNIIWNSTIGKKRVSDFPETVGIEIISKCNLACSMCHNSDLRVEHNVNSRVSLDLVKKLLPEFKKHKPVVSLSGGEPLLHRDLFDMVSLLSKNNVLTSVSTNGTLIKRRIDEILDSGLAFITVSLDHFKPELHDQGRGKQGTFAEVVDGIKLLTKKRKKTPFNIKINTVIREDNFDALPQLYQFIETLGVDEWSLAHLSFLTPKMAQDIEQCKSANGFSTPFYAFDLGRNAVFSDDQIDALVKGVRKLKEMSSIYKTKLSLPTLKEEDYYPYYKGIYPTCKSYCSFPSRGIYIHSGGKVSTCVMDLGDLSKEISLRKIWDSEKANKVRYLQREQKIFPHCLRCNSLSFNFSSDEVKIEPEP